jgi:hypothetical protein
MADRVKKVGYCYMKVPNRAGQGEKVLGKLRDEGVNLLAYSGFPIGKGKAQLDFIPENMVAFRRVARNEGWRISKVKKLAESKINVTAADAMAAGKGRYGMILWVNPVAYNRAAKVLNAK